MALYFYLNESYEPKQEEKSALHNECTVYIRFEDQKIIKSFYTVKHLSKKTVAGSYNRKANFRKKLSHRSLQTFFLSVHVTGCFGQNITIVTGLKH